MGETHAISSMSGALRVKVFMMGWPMSVSPVAGGDFSVYQVLGSWKSGRSIWARSVVRPEGGARGDG